MSDYLPLIDSLGRISISREGMIRFGQEGDLCCCGNPGICVVYIFAVQFLPSTSGGGTNNLRSHPVLVNERYCITKQYQTISLPNVDIVLIGSPGTTPTPAGTVTDYKLRYARSLKNGQWYLIQHWTYNGQIVGSTTYDANQGSGGVIGPSITVTPPGPDIDGGSIRTFQVSESGETISFSQPSNLGLNRVFAVGMNGTSNKPNGGTHVLMESRQQIGYTASNGSGEIFITDPCVSPNTVKQDKEHPNPSTYWSGTSGLNQTGDDLDFDLVWIMQPETPSTPIDQYFGILYGVSHNVGRAAVSGSRVYTPSFSNAPVPQYRVYKNGQVIAEWIATTGFQSAPPFPYSYEIGDELSFETRVRNRFSDPIIWDGHGNYDSSSGLSSGGCGGVFRTPVTQIIL